MSEFLSVHLFFVYFLVFLEFLYFIFCINLKDIHKYIFRIRVLLPAYYTIYACVFFSGILLNALGGFEKFNYLMFFCLFLMFALSIFQFIKFKKARKVKKYKEFRKIGFVLELLKFILLFIAGLKNVLF